MARNTVQLQKGLWCGLPSPHRPRRRRDCLGELVQIDSSKRLLLGSGVVRREPASGAEEVWCAGRSRSS